MKAEFVPGNHVALLESGDAYFPALRKAIDAAAREIYLETYIYENDSTGQIITRALCNAAKRGVIVRVLVDGFGAIDFTSTIMPVMAEHGVQALIYRPEIARFKMARHRLRRLHRKLAVIDGRIAFVGGINIIDDMHTPKQIPPRYDYAVQIEGPLLAAIHESVLKLWELVSWVSFKRRFRGSTFTPPVTAWCGSMRAAFLTRDNIRHRRDIENAYLSAITSARREIVLAHAYFLPGIRFRHALIEAAQRGVKVTILLQGRVEYFLLHYASQALYSSLLTAGIHIFEYHKSFLHAKVAVIDNRWATVGSSNIDPFSLFLAREANIVVQDTGFAQELRRSLQRAMDTGALELRREIWHRKFWPSRLIRQCAYHLVRLMVGIAGYRGEH